MHIHGRSFGRGVALATLPLLLVACDVPPEGEGDEGMIEVDEQPVTEGPLLEPPSRAPKFAEPFRSGNIFYPRWNRAAEIVMFCMESGEGHRMVPDAAMLATLRTAQAHYSRVSQGRFRPTSVGTFGCGGRGGILQSPPNKRGSYYEDRARQIGGEQMRYEYRADVLQAAERAGFNFARYDRNRDQIVTGDELAVIITRPYSADSGSVRQTYPTLTNVREVTTVDLILSATVANQAYRDGLIVHELAHAMFGAGDMYDTPLFRAHAYSIMDNNGGLNWFDPFHLLKLGWLKPKVQPIQAGNLKIRTIDSSGEVAIFYDPNVRKAEYFIVDVRGVGGVTLWRIVEDKARVQSSRWGQAYQNAGWFGTDLGWGRWAIHKVNSTPIPQGGTADLEMTSGQVTHRIRVTSPVAQGNTRATTTIAVERK